MILISVVERQACQPLFRQSSYNAYMVLISVLEWRQACQPLFTDDPYTISVVEWRQACQPLFTENPYTMPTQTLYPQKLIAFLFLYNDWQGLYYKMNELALSLLKE